MKNTICLCIDQVIDQEFVGRLYHRLAPSPIAFIDVHRIVLIMDQLFDELKFPQASNKSRTFYEEKPLASPLINDLEGRELMDTEELLAHKGDKGTFIIQVQYRQNSTWQGNIVWAEKNIKKPFRSALEMLKLIDGALDITNNPSWDEALSADNN